MSSKHIHWEVDDFSVDAMSQLLEISPFQAREVLESMPIDDMLRTIPSAIPHLNWHHLAVLGAAFDIVKISQRESFTLSATKQNYTVLECAAAFQPFINAESNKEHFYLLCLNEDFQYLSVDKIASGGIAGVRFAPVTLFSVATKRGATHIAIAHNHPSGTYKPSNIDIDAVEKIERLLDSYEIKLFDSFVFTQSHFHSIRRNESYERTVLENTRPSAVNEASLSYKGELKPEYPIAALLRLPIEECREILAKSSIRDLLDADPSTMSHFTKRHQTILRAAFNIVKISGRERNKIAQQPGLLPVQEIGKYISSQMANDPSLKNCTCLYMNLGSAPIALEDATEAVQMPANSRNPIIQRVRSLNSPYIAIGFNPTWQSEVNVDIEIVAKTLANIAREKGLELILRAVVDITKPQGIIFIDKKSIGQLNDDRGR